MCDGLSPPAVNGVRRKSGPDQLHEDPSQERRTDADVTLQILTQRGGHPSHERRSSTVMTSPGPWPGYCPDHRVDSIRRAEREIYRFGDPRIEDARIMIVCSCQSG